MKKFTIDKSKIKVIRGGKPQPKISVTVNEQPVQQQVDMKPAEYVAPNWLQESMANISKEKCFWRH